MLEGMRAVPRENPTRQHLAAQSGIELLHHPLHARVRFNKHLQWYGVASHLHIDVAIFRYSRLFYHNHHTVPYQQSNEYFNSDK